MNLKKKIIKIKIFLGSGSFDDDGNNVLEVSGLRTQCHIAYGNGLVMPTANIRIFGMKQDSMMKLLRVKWHTAEALQNIIQVEVGDSERTSIVYTGNITFAKPDFATASDVSLLIESHTGMKHQLMPVPPRSFEGETDVAQAIEQIAQDMGFTFENNGVNAKISNPYLPNTALEQIQQLAQAANIDLYIENNIIAIAPKDAPRQIDVPIISPQTDLIGYPIPTLQGVQFACFYDPMLRFGGLVHIENSLITPCNGKWRIFGLNFTLESETPQGKWQADIQAAHAESTNIYVAK